MYAASLLFPGTSWAGLLSLAKRTILPQGLYLGHVKPMPSVGSLDESWANETQRAS